MGGKKNKKEKRIVEVDGCGGVREGVERKGGVLGGWLVGWGRSPLQQRSHWWCYATVPLVHGGMVHGGAAVPLAATSGHQLPNTVSVAHPLCLYKYKYKTHRNVQIQKNSTNM